jgi:hypothetical protein
MAQRALGPARELARQAADAAVSVRELESEIWPWRLVAIGVALGLTLALPWARVEWLPLGLVVLAYMSAYALLRWSNLACPWFCVLLFGMDIVAITAALLLSGGARSTLVLMYMFPVAVMAIARGPWAAATLATAVLALYVGATGPGAALRSAPKDTAALALVLYGSAIVVGRAHAEIRRRETNLAKRLAKLHQGVARISGEASLATLLDESAALGTELTGACYGAISIWDERGETVCLATAGTGERWRASATRRAAQASLRLVRDAPGPVVVANARAHRWRRRSRTATPRRPASSWRPSPLSGTGRALTTW